MSIKVLPGNPFIRRPHPAKWPAAISALLLRWLELSRQRRDLAQLDNRLLRDIGVDRIDAVREARRPFWDDPML
jgi:uncharacterized protein YjiS (DUF1127 family)